MGKEHKAVTLLMKEAEARKFKLIRGSELQAFEYIPCGIPNIDQMGGVRRGGFTVRWGNPGAGKTTLACRYMAEAQKKWPDLAVAVLDSELKFDAAWAAVQGVDLERLIVLRGLGALEDYLDAYNALVKTGALSHTVIDSISAMTPRSMMETSKGEEKSVGDHQVAAAASKIQQWIHMSKEVVFTNNVGCEIIAQVRTHGIGSTYTHDGFSGGHMIRHMATQIWKGDRMGRSEWKFDKIKIDGQAVEVLKEFKTRWTLEKDTGPNESRKAFVNFVVGAGFDDFECHIRTANKLGVIQGGAAGRFTYTNRKGSPLKLHGWDKLVEVFKDSEEFEHLKAKNTEAYYTQQVATGKGLRSDEEAGVAVEEADDQE